MKSVITYENLRLFSYSNDHLCHQPIRGVMIDFIGLGDTRMISDDRERMHRFADLGIIFLHPYVNPWAWMNQQTAAFADELVDVLCKHYHLPDGVPIVSSGGSMGGLQALVYMVYARRTPVACVANCPVCDLPYHYTERPDLPRTLYSAFGSYDMPLADALASASPVHLADKLPDSRYFLFHCEEDAAVNQQKHSDVLAARLAGRRQLVYHSVPGRDHCDLPDNMRALYDQYVIDSIFGS